MTAALDVFSLACAVINTTVLVLMIRQFRRFRDELERDKILRARDELFSKMEGTSQAHDSFS